MTLSPHTVTYHRRVDVPGLPSYLADDCQLVSDVRPRRLRSPVTCAVRRTRTTYGDRGVLPLLAHECGTLCQPN